MLSNGSRYKPDFHLYDNKNNLVEIIEIKSNDKHDVELANQKIILLQEQINVPIKLLFIEDLKRLCFDNKININEEFEHWESISTGRNINIGNKNPRFGENLTDYTKNKIAKKAIERMSIVENREKVRNGVLKYYQNGGIAVGPPLKRENRICINCGIIFETCIGTKKKYCSRQCSLKYSTEIANNKTREIKNAIHNKIRIEIFND